jgi:hypothetical protein
LDSQLNPRYKYVGLFFLAIIILDVLYLTRGKEQVTEAAFTGKWQSSKLETPTYLYPNGEWELKKDDGTILQYGVWRYEDKKIIWSFKAQDGFIHDPNPVLSFKPDEFKLKEKDGTTTIFTRLPES